MKINTVHNINFLDNALPDKSVQLIIADPPYYKVKGDFDFIWPSFGDYLADVEKWCLECKRLLADNGTLFWYGHAKNIAYAQVIFDKHFNLLNSLMWRKVDSMQYQYYSPDLARTFNTHNERILMYGNEMDETGLEKIMEENIKPRHPFALYLTQEMDRSGVSRKEISKLFPSSTGGLTGCVSNWLNGDNVITKEQYNIIRGFLGANYLRREYEDLRREYEDLRREYEDLRRYFYNPKKYEEVLEFSQESHKTKGFDHDTVKPEALTSVLILTCSRPGDTVLAPFAGSGTECACAIKEGRTAIGFDVEKRYCDMANERIAKVMLQPRLFV